METDSAQASETLRTSSADEFRAEVLARGFAYSTVVGASMVPTLRPGEILRFAACLRPSRGEIVAFSLGNSLLVHRVVTVRGELVTCRGDNTVRDDPPVPVAAVLGRLVAISGRSRVPDAPRDVARALARYTVRRETIRVCRSIGELRLLAAQAGWVGSPPALRLRLTGWDGPEAVAEGAHVVRPDEFADGRRVGESIAAGVPLVVPAGVFCGLTQAERRALLAGSADRRVTVWAYMRSSGGRVVRGTSWIRRRLAARGVRAGVAGDMFMPLDSLFSGIVVHTFTAAELAAEIESAGGREVSVAERQTDWGRLLCARVRL